MLWEGSLRSCLDRPLGGVKRLFSFWKFGPFSSIVRGALFCYRLRRMPRGAAFCRRRSNGGATKCWRYSAYDLQGPACHGALLIFHLRFYPLLSLSFKRLLSSLLLFGVSATSRRTGPFRFSDRSRRRRSARSPAVVVVVAAVGAFD